MSKNVWEDLHKVYEGKDWLNKPSIFAEEVASYLPEKGTLLELGAGQGQDSIYFAQLGYNVTSTDIEHTALDKAKKKTPDDLNITFEPLDLSAVFPYPEASYDIVYAHLSLHYFDEVITRQIMNEVLRVLKPGGIFAFFVNSINDPEYGTGEKIEEDVHFVEGNPKRYFSKETAKNFAKDFVPIIADENGETYKDRDKGVHNLVRFIGRKPE